jgi:type IV pilus assembly protein PilO
MAINLRELPPLVNILLALALAVVVVLLGLFVPGSPVLSQRQEIQKADQQIARLEPEVAQLRDSERRHAELKAQIAALQKQLEVLRTIVPEEKDVDEFIRMVHSSAASSSVELRRVTAKPVVAKEYYNELPFELEFDGPYYSVMSFFSRLGRLSRIINVSDLKFSGADSSKGGSLKYPIRAGTSVVATCTATTFFTKTDEAPAKPGQPGQQPAPAKR